MARDVVDSHRPDAPTIEIFQRKIVSRRPTSYQESRCVSQHAAKIAEVLFIPINNLKRVLPLLLEILMGDW
jgi:hypothetical protein